MLLNQPDGTDQDHGIEYDEESGDNTLAPHPERSLINRPATYLSNIHRTPRAPQASTPTVTSQIET